MKLLKPKVELIKQGYTLSEIYKHIELCGRTCYHSQDLITETSAERFVNNLIKSGHLSVLEHSTVYLTINNVRNYELAIFRTNPYSIVNTETQEQIDGSFRLIWHITTNYRVIIENNLLEKCKPWIVKPTIYHSERFSFKVVCSIAISREFNRHRSLSISEQSTRYCNYSKDKFDNQLSFIIPNWLDLEEGIYKPSTRFNIDKYSWHFNKPDSEPVCIECDLNTHRFLEQMVAISCNYMDMIRDTYKPQQARDLLPLCTATEVVYTGFKEQWHQVLKQRCDSAAHPDAQFIANQIQTILNNK